MAAGCCLLALSLVACNHDRYEVIERAEKQMPDFMGSGIHTGMNYVLSHEGHKIYATCDVERFRIPDPENTCGFQVLKTYACVSGSDSIAHGDPWDLKCKDADGHNVYLYVQKKE